MGENLVGSDLMRTRDEGIDLFEQMSSRKTAGFVFDLYLYMPQKDILTALKNYEKNSVDIPNIDEKLF